MVARAKKKTAEAEAAPVNAERLRELVTYDQDTGEFRWAVNKASNARIGSLLASRHSAGYLAGRIDGRAYLLHRLAWLYVHGQWPLEQIDHINGDRADNRIANLRECSNAENCQNMARHRDSRSRYVGVTYSNHVIGRPWLASVFAAGKRTFVGYFATEEEASKARGIIKPTVHAFQPTDRGI